MIYSIRQLKKRYLAPEETAFDEGTNITIMIWDYARHFCAQITAAWSASATLWTQPCSSIWSLPPKQVVIVASSMRFLFDVTRIVIAHNNDECICCNYCVSRDLWASISKCDRRELYKRVANTLDQREYCMSPHKERFRRFFNVYEWTTAQILSSYGELFRLADHIYCYSTSYKFVKCSVDFIILSIAKMFSTPVSTATRWLRILTCLSHRH